LRVDRWMRRRIQKRLSKGKSVVVDGVRSPVEAGTIKRLGGIMVRADNGTVPDQSKPMDIRQASVSTEYAIDASGKRKPAGDRPDDRRPAVLEAALWRQRVPELSGLLLG